MNSDENRLLGEIKGKLDLVIDGQTNQNKKLESLDERLRKVETKAALNGAVAGGIMSIGIAIVIEKLKNVTGVR